MIIFAGVVRVKSAMAKAACCSKSVILNVVYSVLLLNDLCLVLVLWCSSWCPL